MTELTSSDNGRLKSSCDCGKREKCKNGDKAVSGGQVVNTNTTLAYNSY